jgi:hypothetical protein
MRETPMFSKALHRVPAHLDIVPLVFEAPPDDLDWYLCNQCLDRLCMHQPDLQSSARLLGTCSRCLRWYLILMEPGLTSGMMVLLPDNKSLRAGWDAHGGPDGHAVDSSSVREGLEADLELPPAVYPEQGK